MSIRSTMVAALLLGAGTAQAATLPTSAPLLVADGNAYSCAVVNVTGKALTSVVLSVWRADGSLGANTTCAPLDAGAVCSFANPAVGDSYRYCNVTGANKTAVRGTFCNTVTSVCVPVQ